MTAVERLDAIAARADAATGGPWTVVPGASNVWRFPEDGAPTVVVSGNGSQGHHTRLTDAEFIAAARQDVPALVVALHAVLALHKPETVSLPASSDEPDSEPHMVTRCTCQPAWRGYPCLTVRAITDVLDPS